MKLARVLVDPTLLFALSILVIGPLREEGNKLEQLKEAFFDKTILCMYALTAVILLWVHYGGRKTKNLSAGDQRAAMWYLVNAIVFHTLGDCLVGTFHLYPPLDRQYKILDLRFANEGAVPAVIGFFEMTVMAPICVMIYRAYVQGRSYVHELELIIGGIHAFGAYVFVADEVWNGQKNLHADWDLSFDEPEILYYWFGTWICNGIWIVVPVYMMRRAYLRIKKQKSKASKSAKKTQ